MQLTFVSEFTDILIANVLNVLMASLKSFLSQHSRQKQ